MVGMEDYIVKVTPEYNSGDRPKFLDKIELGEKRLLRPIIDWNDKDFFYQFVPVHRYIKGKGTVRCINTKENLEKGVLCPFCDYVTKELTKVEDKANDFLKEVLKEKFGETTKLHIKKGVSPELKSNLTDDQLKTLYDIISKGKSFRWIERKYRNFMPVYDHGSKSIRIYEFPTDVYNKLKELFLLNNRALSSCDIMIHHKGERSNWWGVSREDTSPIPEDAVKLFDKEKESIKTYLKNFLQERTVDSLQEVLQRHLSDGEVRSDKEVEEKSSQTDTVSGDFDSSKIEAF